MDITVSILKVILGRGGKRCYNAEAASEKIIGPSKSPPNHTGSLFNIMSQTLSLENNKVVAVGADW